MIFLIFSFAMLNSAAQDQHVYYGYVPLRVGESGEAKLYIVGNHDGTSVKVLSLPDIVVIAEFTVDKLEEKALSLPNGTFFKIVSDRPVTAILAGGDEVEAVTRSITTFYTSVDGGYVGREFVFRTFAKGRGLGAYTLYAVEASEVTIFNSTGDEVISLKLSANEYKDFNLNPSEVHRLVSTGRVMLQSFAQKAPGAWGGVTRWSSYFVPSPEGGFMGRYFYARGAYPGPYKIYTSYVFTSSQESALRIYDLEAKSKMSEEAVPAGGNLTFQSLRPHIFFQSEKPMMLAIFANDGGLMAACLKAGQEAYVRVPSDESFIFAHEDTVLVMDGAQYSISADEAFQLPIGLHQIQADKNVILIMVDYGVVSSLPSFGACLPSVQLADIEYPDLKIVSLEPGFPWLTIVGAVVAVVAVAGVVIALRRVRSR
jgi:hypothetical protein